MNDTIDLFNDRDTTAFTEDIASNKIKQLESKILTLESKLTI